MNIYTHFKQQLEPILEDILPKGTDFSKVVVEPPRDASHGDLATNAAMVLSKVAGANPRELAGKIAEKVEALDSISAVEVAGPGFINIRMEPAFWGSFLTELLNQGVAYGKSQSGAGAKVNVEYVSANPTGPLTVGHARGAVVGDVLANLLETAGYDVQREYYMNDAGNQVKVLGESAFLRYREALGEDIGEIPAGCYPGEYLKEVGAKIADEDGDKWLTQEDYLDHFKSRAIVMMTEEIKADLKDMGISHDLFYSEKSAVESGKVEAALQALTDLDLIYQGILEPPKGKKPEDWEEREQTLFASTRFGDDVDRPLKKSDGSFTYFANDIAHFYDIFMMGYPTLINVVGADHGGYVKRAVAAVSAISESKADLSLPLCAIVNVFDNGQPVRMSKRAGTYITLRDVLDRVGPDVLRFIMLTRKSDQTLDSDFTKVTEESKDNPVFYVQYAHARCRSVLRNAQEKFGSLEFDKVDFSVLSEDAELNVIKTLSHWPRMVEISAAAREPHRIAFYLQDLAAVFHSWWSTGNADASKRFLIDDDQELSLARVALVQCVAHVIASALGVMGVVPLEELRSDMQEEDAA